VRAGRWHRSGEFSPSSLLDEWIATIFLGKDGFLHRPRNAQRRVIPANATCAAGMEKFGHLIKNFGVIDERLKSMGKTAWNEDRRPIFCGNLRAEPLQIGPGTLPDVDNDVVDGAHRTSHEFVFRMRF